MRRYLLRFLDGEGSALTELLYSKSDDAGLVDSEGLELSMTDSFVRYGRTWRVVDVLVTDDRVSITCMEVAAPEEADAMRHAAARTSAL